MRRRDFISLVGGAVAASPLGARAQQVQQVQSRIAVLMGLQEDSRDGRKQASALRKGLEEAGWTDGGNIRVDFHWDVGQPGRAQVVAKDILATAPDLIVSHTSPITLAVFQLTKIVPVVFVSIPDPIVLGLVANYARPGGNVTGFANFEPTMGGKWVEVLKDVDPAVRRIAILFNPETATGNGQVFLPSFKESATALDVEPIEARVHDVAEIEKAIDDLARVPAGGLVAMPDIFLSTNRATIIRSAVNHRVPLISAFSFFTEDGGLISYGVSVSDLFYRAATYVDRILKGAKPADLPVQTLTKFEMTINLKTAKALGLNVSRDFQLRADEVIE
jgi:putative tryptophan/tyrosine transport system substrate-binding protein